MRGIIRFTTTDGQPCYIGPVESRGETSRVVFRPEEAYLFYDNPDVGFVERNWEANVRRATGLRITLTEYATPPLALSKILLFQKEECTL
jgi:hypothetical protein